jgi:hypothetical protein
MTLTELIALLEAAQEGSRELDRLICESVFNVCADRDDPGPWTSEHPLHGGAVIEIDAPTRVLRYTTSLDAALVLLPAGWVWQVRVAHRNRTPVVRALAFNDRAGMVLASECCEAEASTAPIAVCIAALRACAVVQPAPASAPTRRRAP